GYRSLEGLLLIPIHHVLDQALASFGALYPGDAQGLAVEGCGPQVGDQVLLGFRHGDPARPYVMGSLFNGTTGGGGGQGNKCKSLTTRSGSSLKLDDSDGSVTLHDKGGVSMNFDGSGNATTNVNANHTIKAGSKTSTNVGKGASVLSMDCGGNIDLTGQSKVNIKVGGAAISMNGSSITLSIGSSSITLTSDGISSKGTMLTMESTTGTRISGGQSIDISATQNHIGGETKMDGGDVFVN
ncbi:phage baseplate assembly protein V, partial [Prevotella histicola]|uniref:phage baseplate assembly protein V n=1 Tax=Prevotella histicola TaxID=470565 RepID=UPI00360C2725